MRRDSQRAEHLSKTYKQPHTRCVRTCVLMALRTEWVEWRFNKCLLCLSSLLLIMAIEGLSASQSIPMINGNYVALSEWFFLSAMLLSRKHFREVFRDVFSRNVFAFPFSFSVGKDFRSKGVQIFTQPNRLMALGCFVVRMNFSLLALLQWANVQGQKRFAASS